MSNVCFVQGVHVIMKIIDVHVHAGSSTGSTPGSTRLTLGLDILHIGIPFLKGFLFSS